MDFGAGFLSDRGPAFLLQLAEHNVANRVRYNSGGRRL